MGYALENVVGAQSVAPVIHKKVEIQKGKMIRRLANSIMQLMLLGRSIP